MSQCINIWLVVCRLEFQYYLANLVVLKVTMAVVTYYCLHSTAFLMCSYNSEEGVEEVSSEPSLAEMFEQMRHCRYIRHYHPDGTAVEEYY